MESPRSSFRRRTAVLRVVVFAAAAALAGACGGEGAAGEGGSASAGEADRSSASSAEEARAGESAGTSQAFPEGWEVRTDPGQTSPEAVDFVATDDGYRVRPGPRAIYWDPGMTTEGTYRFSATFQHFNEPSPPEAYGVFVGGRDLQSPEQDYLYFLIRRDGKFLVKHRAGDETHTLTDWTGHDAVETGPAEQGSPLNTLVVESREDAVRFLVNGTEVQRLERAPMLSTDGQAGVRVNHKLDVRFTDLRLEPLGDGDGAGGG